MSEKRESKKRKCNDKKEEELSHKFQEGKHEYTIEVLNYHCLGEIISYLGPVDRLNLEKLCEKMTVASNIAWRRIKNLEMSTTKYSETIKQCSIKAHGTQNITKQILVRCGNYLESLHLDPCGKTLMSSVVNKCHNLRNLTIECQTFNNNNFKGPFENMKNLKCFKIKLSKEDNSGILKRLPENIEEISIECSENSYYARLLISPEDFKNFSKKWKALHSLTLKWFTIDESSNVIFDKIYPLTRLDLIACFFSDVRQTKLLISNYENLEHLNLMNSGPVDDHVINIIINNFQNLKYLNVQNCFNFSKKSLKELGKLKNLEEINISRSSADDDVLAKFKNLKRLSCELTAVRDTGAIIALDNSPNLEYLNVLITLITANTLSHAANLTNCREKKLIIRASKNIIESFEQRIEISPFLDLKDSC